MIMRNLGQMIGEIAASATREFKAEEMEVKAQQLLINYISDKDVTEAEGSCEIGQTGLTVDYTKNDADEFEITELTQIKSVSGFKSDIGSYDMPHVIQGDEFAYIDAVCQELGVRYTPSKTVKGLNHDHEVYYNAKCSAINNFAYYQYLLGTKNKDGIIDIGIGNRLVDEVDDHRQGYGKGTLGKILPEVTRLHYLQDKQYFTSGGMYLKDCNSGNKYYVLTHIADSKMRYGLYDKNNNLITSGWSKCDNLLSCWSDIRSIAEKQLGTTFESKIQYFNNVYAVLNNISLDDALLLDTDPTAKEEYKNRYFTKIVQVEKEVNDQLCSGEIGSAEYQQKIAELKVVKNNHSALTKHILGCRCFPEFTGCNAKKWHDEINKGNDKKKDKRWER